ncbi:hypothetical protein [Enterovibrio coralii]|uniref:Anti-sigma factor n=1 Tax=Enterovibrio coralii TaxID=294935 RepID=A0A135IC47_9GAMM|nr:hypothetical protein [Enterovibrio coralii]KXF83036.1 hypothetical protein ATN88_04700 [Enterovibrio coralii]
MRRSNQSFKASLRQLYGDKTLSDEQLEQLQAAKQSQGLPRKLQPLLAAALLLCASFLVFTSSNQDHQRIATEIAYNHNSQMQMEVQSGAFTDIQHYLNRLDFSLIASEKLPESVWRLIGGRYCSIDGKLAAQLKVEHLESGDIYTLYQAKLPDMFSAEGVSDAIDVDGVEVRLWQEGGLLFGLAK